MEADAVLCARAAWRAAVRAVGEAEDECWNTQSDSPLSYAEACAIREAADVEEDRTFEAYMLAVQAADQSGAGHTQIIAQPGPNPITSDVAA